MAANYSVARKSLYNYINIVVNNILGIKLLTTRDKDSS